MKVMRLSSMEPTAQVVLLDSGATHGLRPAASQEEWDSAEATQVMLADGVTESLRLKLPCGATPLQFGDWLYLCGPNMRDLSNVAGRWWDLTVRQAQIYYQEWKVVSPLQRVQLQPHLPDELLYGCYTRTEQRGVHLLLKAVSAEQQQELVVDRDLSSTAILFRLYICHQPAGPGEKAILLGQLTTLQKLLQCKSWLHHCEHGEGTLLVHVKLMQVFLMAFFFSKLLKMQCKRSPRKMLKPLFGCQQAVSSWPLMSGLRSSQFGASVSVFWLKQKL